MLPFSKYEDLIHRFLLAHNIELLGIDFLPHYMTYVLSLKLIQNNFIWYLYLDNNEILNQFYVLIESITKSLRDYNNGLWN